jgi:DNA-binding transcriptional ArsR family regulator
MPNSLALDTVFHALSNPTRRSVVERLGRGPAGMTELSKAFSMALPSFLQHLRVLEGAGLVASRKEGRVRVFQLRPQALEQAEHWLDVQRRQWDTRLDQLDALLARQAEGGSELRE